MIRLVVRVTHFALNLLWNLVCPLRYSALRLRKNFEILGWFPIPILKMFFPGLSFKALSHGPLKFEEILPATAPSKTVVYFHGGGYFLGSAASYRKFSARLAYVLNARVLMVEYRLAPEHPFPAALDDAKAAIEFAQSHFKEPVVIGGDSAGGGLALAALLSLRDEGRVLPKAAFCLSPWTDLSGSGASWNFNEPVDFWLSHRHRKKWSPWYRGNLPETHPLVSPLYGDYKGICPLLLLVGTEEVLLDDSRVLAEKAKAQDVQVALHIEQGMQHAWPIAIPFLKQSREAIEIIRKFVGSV